MPIFIPAYPLTGDSSAANAPDAEPEQAGQSVAEDADAGASTPDTDALREAYYRGAQDALAAARQRAQNSNGDKDPFAVPFAKDRASGGSKDNSPKDDDDAKPEPPADDSPAAVFVFKDGHKLETRNYAIQGQTLFDFSNNHLTKIKLAEIDLDATKKANDDLGVAVRFPPGAP